MNKLRSRRILITLLMFISFFSWGRLVVAQESVGMEGEVQRLLGHPAKVLTLSEIDRLGLHEREARFLPWSGSFWPDITGGIAAHYRDHSVFGDQILFALRYGAARGRLHGDFERVRDGIRHFSEDEINQKLSPAEKYDLLLGDLDFHFTRAVLEDIDFRASHLKRSKFDGDDTRVAYRFWKPRPDSLSYWFGICDGWSPASIHLPRPVRPVTVTGGLGHRVTFFPDDLKALGSYLFARTNNDYMSSIDYRFAGKPCRGRGSRSDARCGDVDPALWHLILVNRLGWDRTGFMLDVDNNRKINNHPVSSYSLSYFNPRTMEAGPWQTSMIPTHDGHSLLGVKSSFTYRFYQWPEKHRHLDYDSVGLDHVKSRTYSYLLETGPRGEILTGQWLGDVQEQPDFVWLAPPESLPYSEQSLYLIPGTPLDSRFSRPFGNMKWAWNGRGPLPEDWAQAARVDREWRAPITGRWKRGPDGRDADPVESRDSVLKPAQPLSTLIYYLFDQARVSDQR